MLLIFNRLSNLLLQVRNLFWSNRNSLKEKKANTRFWCFNHCNLKNRCVPVKKQVSCLIGFKTEWNGSRNYFFFLLFCPLLSGLLTGKFLKLFQERTCTISIFLSNNRIFPVLNSKVGFNTAKFQAIYFPALGRFYFSKLSGNCLISSFTK